MPHVRLILFYLKLCWGLRPQTPTSFPPFITSFFNIYNYFEPVGASPQTPPGGYAPWTPNDVVFYFTLCWGSAPNPGQGATPPLDLRSIHPPTRGLRPLDPRSWGRFPPPYPLHSCRILFFLSVLFRRFVPHLRNKGPYLLGGFAPQTPLLRRRRGLILRPLLLRRSRNPFGVSAEDVRLFVLFNSVKARR